MALENIFILTIYQNYTLALKELRNWILRKEEGKQFHIIGPVNQIDLLKYI